MLRIHRRAIVLWVLAISLSLTSLWSKPFADDFYHRLALDGAPLRLPFGALTLYNFTGVAGMQGLVAEGYFPWQSHPALSFRFLRPLASLSIACDYYLFGRSELPSHLVNLALYLALVAVVLAVHRRVLPSSRSWFATLLYATAGAHTINLAWIAGRHMLLAGIFGALALLLHLRARAPLEGESPLARWLAPIALMLALLSSEAALGALAFLVSYEAFGSSDALRARIRAITPASVLCICYLVLYAALGCGTRHSSLYAEPFRQPRAFLEAVQERLPTLLGELTTALPSGVWGKIPQARAILATVGIVGGVVLVTLLILAPLDGGAARHVRWLGIATLGSLLPLSGGVPDGRLLVLPLIGATALIATVVEANWNASRRTLPRLAIRAVLCILLALQFGLGAGVRLVFPLKIAKVAEGQERFARTSDASACEPGAIGLVLTGSDPTVSLYGLASIAYYRPDFLERVPRLFVISQAPHAQLLKVAESGTFTLSVEESPRRSNIFETLFNDTGFHAGQSVPFGELSARVLDVDHGLPTRVAFTVPVKSCLFILEGQRLVGRALPPAGQDLAVPYERGLMGL